MKRKKITGYYLMYCLLVILPIYQDSPLSQYLGAAGYSLMMPISLILFFAFSLAKRKIPKNSELKGIWKLGKWIAITSLVGIVIWLIMGGTLTVVGEFLPVKAVKVWAQFISYPCYIALLLYYIRKIKNEEKIFIPIFIGLLIMLGIEIVEQMQMPYAFQSLHFSGIFPYYRVRLLTREASMTAILIFIYAGLSIYYGLTYKKRTVLALSIIAAAIFILTSESKSLLSSIAVYIIIYALISRKKYNLRTIVRLIIGAIALYIFTIRILPRLVESFGNDIQNYTSVATRIYTSAIGLMIGVVFPFGVGGAAYLGFFQQALSKYLPSFEGLPIRFNTIEIMSLINSNTDSALTVKTGLFHFNMYYGIIGTIFLLRIFHRVSKSLMDRKIQNHEIIRSLLWVSVIMLGTSSNFCFEFWMLVAIMIGLSERMSSSNAIMQRSRNNT